MIKIISLINTRIAQNKRKKIQRWHAGTHVEMFTKEKEIDTINSKIMNESGKSALPNALELI